MIFELSVIDILRSYKGFPVFISPETVDIDKNTDDDVALAAPDEVFKSDPACPVWFHHVEHFIYQIFHVHLTMTIAFHLSSSIYL